jgi:hypothetical protein
MYPTNAEKCVSLSLPLRPARPLGLEREAGDHIGSENSLENSFQRCREDLWSVENS